MHSHPNIPNFLSSVIFWYLSYIDIITISLIWGPKKDVSWNVKCTVLQPLVIWFDAFLFLSYVNIIIIVQTKTVYPELDILFLRAVLFSSNDKKKTYQWVTLGTVRHAPSLPWTHTVVYSVSPSKMNRTLREWTFYICCCLFSFRHLPW